MYMYIEDALSQVLALIFIWCFSNLCPAACKGGRGCVQSCVGDRARVSICIYAYVCIYVYIHIYIYVEV